MAVKYSFFKICIIFDKYFPVFHYFVYRCNKMLYFCQMPCHIIKYMKPDTTKIYNIIHNSRSEEKVVLQISIFMHGYKYQDHMGCCGKNRLYGMQITKLQISLCIHAVLVVQFILFKV